MDELWQLAPVQFIEGINENQEPIEPDEGRFWQPKDLQVAIPYAPGRVYTLSRIELFASPHELPKEQEHLVRLYTDNKGTPGCNFVSSGRLVVPAEADGADWLNIHLDPVVVFVGQQYWIAVEDYSPRFAIGVAKVGHEITKTGRRPRYEWVSLDQKIRYMIRFFGRVLPVATIAAK